MFASTRSSCGVAAAVACLFGPPAVATSPAALAQSFPARQITIVVPFAPGGPSDTMARLIADGMGRNAGSRVLIENVAGAGGTTGSARVAKAEPDGYTLVFGNIGTHAANVGLYKALPYDPTTDFAPVALVASVPLVLSVRLGHPAHTYAEFAALARSKPGDMTYGSAGIGSASHLGCLLLDAALGAKSRHVPYRGVGPALNDLVAGQLDFMCDQTVTMMPQISAKTIRPLATLSAKRLGVLPDLPTVAEAGTNGVTVEVWNGLFAPKGTPPARVDEVFALIRKALAEPTVGQRLVELGGIVPGAEQGSPAALKLLVASEVKRWRDALRDADVVPQ